MSAGDDFDWESWVNGLGGEETPAPSSFSLPDWASSPLALSLGLQTAGALVKGKAAQDAARRKMALADAMGRYKMANAAQQTGVVNKFLTTDTPEARAASTQAATDEAKLGFEKSVGAAQAFAKPGDVAGNVSDRFKADGLADADATMARNNKLIANLSAMRAPGLSSAARSRTYGRAAGEIGGLNSAAANVGNAYGVDMANVQASPWAGVTGDVLSGVGQGVALTDAMKRYRGL